MKKRDGQEEINMATSVSSYDHARVRDRMIDPNYVITFVQIVCRADLSISTSIALRYVHVPTCLCIYIYITVSLC